MIKFSILILVSSLNIFPQNTFTSRLENTAQNIYTGFMESVEFYDIPVGALFVSRNYLFVHDNTKILNIRPFDFDKDLQKNFGKNGRESIGSMDQTTIPMTILYSRAAFSVARNLISPENASSDDFKRLIVFYKSLVYTHTLTEFTKNLVQRERPDKSDARSFFSGHTSVTFAAASFLYRELEDYIDDFDFSGRDFMRTGLKITSFSLLYGWAGYVAYARMYDNKHYLSDVLLGAAAGTLISNLLFNVYMDDNDTILNNIGLGVINNHPALSINLKF